ncbi:hypothetical protein GQ457_03G016760 [Hibiscus cannabinus]
MADSLLTKLGDLTSTAEEQDAVVVAPDAVAISAEDFASSLVGKVVSPPTVDGSRLIRQFPSIWKDDKVLNISEINPNFFLISFASPANRTNVLKRGPWDFQKYWFTLEQADPNRTIHDYSFLHMCIWVRIHNIPLSLMTTALARVLGASIGKVIMTDTRLVDGNMGEFMRVCVLIDTSKPLRRCVVLSRPDTKASMCPLQYERLPLFCHECGLIGHSVLACPTTPKVEGQKFQYGAWLHAPLPKRSTTHPRGRLSVVDDDLDAPVLVDSAAEGPSVRPGSNGTTASISAPEPVVPIVAAPAVRTPPPVAVSPADNPPDLSAPSGKADLMEEALDETSPEQDASELAIDRSIPDDAPYDPMVHTEAFDMLEEALEISWDCVLLADLTVVIQADGEDLVNEAISEAADSIIREAPFLSASPSKPGLSKSAPAGLRRATMPVVPEHHEFDEWCAARSRTPPAIVQNQPTGARASSIPPARPHKRQASSSDLSRAKRSRPSTSSTTRIPSVPKAGISSVNNSPAETARHMHGRSESTLKKHNWALIDRLCGASPLPWLLGGDFNEILTLSEKQGGTRKPHHQLTDFHECLLRNNLADCKPSRGWFTWMKSGPRVAPIRERLDRFIAEKDWFPNVPTFWAWSEYSPNSDHHFILLDTVTLSVTPEARGKNPIFRFDDCWACEAECISLVQSLWAHSTGPFAAHLSTICDGLRQWQSAKRAADWGRIPRLRSEINRLSSHRLNPEDLKALLAAKGELHHLLNVQEVYWAQRSQARGKNPIFRFNDCWACEAECISLVQSLWAHSIGPFAARLSTICDGLRQWQSAKRAADWGRIPRLRLEINRLSSHRLNPEDLKALLAAKGELHHLLKVQKVYWAQRSQVLWLSTGDRNTSFFHAKASARQKKNALLGLCDANGHWRTSSSDVLRIASDYFVDLFSASPLVEAPAFLEHISPSVTEDMNSGLMAAFTSDEVIAAFRDINPRKSLGIDGLPSGFFHQH